MSAVAVLWADGSSLDSFIVVNLLLSLFVGELLLSLFEGDDISISSSSPLVLLTVE